MSTRVNAVYEGMPDGVEYAGCESTSYAGRVQVRVRVDTYHAVVLVRHLRIVRLFHIIIIERSSRRSVRNHWCWHNRCGI